jgi:transcriptional regulator with PAS, ATPase and Fis domain
MDKVTEQWFGLNPGSACGRNLADFFPDSGLLEVAKTGVPQIGRTMEIRGQKRLVTRLPVVRNRQVIGAIGTMVFHDLEEIQNRLPGRTSNDRFTNSKHLYNSAEYTFDDILGTSESIIETKERVSRIARTDSPVLLVGETGTGKELFAHSIHNLSGRAKAPFVRVNCGSIPTELAESELFGYAKGAFTGGNNVGHVGKFELASGGTVFLDEISSMPLAIQAKVLRVIQEKEIQPLGYNETKKLDFRLIAATNIDLYELVEKGCFRSDLYYRLTSMPVFISPLRERRKDILYLTKSMLPGINQKLLGTVESISDYALKIMNNYRWPGNVRELINALEQSVVNAYPNKEIDVPHLPPALRPKFNRPSPETDMRRAVANAERSSILEALKTTGGNKRQAAHLLGVSRTWLYQKLHRLGLVN